MMNYHHGEHIEEIVVLKFDDDSKRKRFRKKGKSKKFQIEEKQIWNSCNIGMFY
jgi:hypothetical protein